MLRKVADDKGPYPLTHTTPTMRLPGVPIGVQASRAASGGSVCWSLNGSADPVYFVRLRRDNQMPRETTPQRLRIIAIGLVSIAPGYAVRSSAVEVGLQKQLLVDDYVIAEKQNVARELGKAKKCGIVMKPTLPTDFQSGVVSERGDEGEYPTGSLFGFSSIQASNN